MRRRFVSIGLLAALLCIGLLGAGCDSGNVPAVAPAPKAGTAQHPNKQQGGGVDDMTLYPAPSGQKTGTEGGKK